MGFECDSCHKVFNLKGNLLKHIKALHSVTKPKFNCSECSKSFSFSLNLTKHEKLVHGVRNKKQYQSHKRFQSFIGL